MLAGLEALARQKPDIVLIHDAARPFPSRDLVARAVDAAKAHGAAAPGTPLSDTVKQVDAEGKVLATPARASLRAVQTPQAFRFPLILEAHRRAALKGVDDLTDDVAVAEWAGAPAFVFEGDPMNLQGDDHAGPSRGGSAAHRRGGRDPRRPGFRRARLRARRPSSGFAASASPTRRRSSGHSDADVGLHALADAIYGALAEGDIGAHFPPSDPQWKGAASHLFLAHAAERVRARGGVIVHLDATLDLRSAEDRSASRGDARPRRRDRRPRRRPRRGQGDDDRSGSASPGRSEGIACLATATVRLPAK